MELKFIKLHGTGNDFILIDNTKEIIPQKDYPKIAKKLSERRKGIGADGVLFLEKDPNFSYFIQYFNCDGSQAELCGNAGRCLVLYESLKKRTKEELIFRSKIGTHRGIMRKGKPYFELPPPEKIKLDIKINEIEEKVHYIKIGVPHVVIFVKNLSNLDVAKLGRMLRHHPKFYPDGVNVEFVEYGKKIKVRSYERGIEGETLSCGTGAAAVGLIVNIKYGHNPPIQCEFPGGKLIIDFSKEGKVFKNIFLGGDTQLVFEGITKI